MQDGRVLAFRMQGYELTRANSVLRNDKNARMYPCLMQWVQHDKGQALEFIYFAMWRFS